MWGTLHISRAVYTSHRIQIRHDDNGFQGCHSLSSDSQGGHWSSVVTRRLPSLWICSEFLPQMPVTQSILGSGICISPWLSCLLCCTSARIRSSCRRVLPRNTRPPSLVHHASRLNMSRTQQVCSHINSRTPCKPHTPNKQTPQTHRHTIHDVQPCPR